MALPFDYVHTRKIALAAQYGYAPNEVPEHGVTDEYIEVLVHAYDRERKPSDLVEYRHHDPCVRVRWDTAEQVAAAIKARDEDWAETLASRGITH
ncbi:hypothetical protein [Microbacterium sp. LWH12-1.2]|uniref:hypothetical protein n=1 Tax=Microbacterium sp. LWH12-1.2 TaxID=3135259 RepID=UPI003445FB6A